MLSTRTFLRGAVAFGLIAALMPGLWAQSLQQQPTVTPPGGTDAPRSLTEAQQAGTARRTMLGNKVSPSIGTDAPPTATAQGGLIWFTNQAEFEAFVGGQRKVLKGIETYEESILNPNAVDPLDDPLESGVPNSPDGFPFPDGLTGLSNLLVQSNFEHSPGSPNPRGAGALAAVSVGFAKAVSDIVVANTFVDSLDLIFADGKSGVGFDTLTFVGGPSVEVRVYSPFNVFLGEMASPADPTGANFIGVWSLDPIGRINVFDPSNGAEGGDNIQAWQGGKPGACGDPASGDCCEANGTPGCNHFDCCQIVCAVNPFCCDVAWDSICVADAEDLCGNLCFLPPVNDLCEDAIPLEVPSFTVGTTNGATTDNAFPDCGMSINTPGVWYSVNGTGTKMTATTCADFFDYDTKISVFCGSCEESSCVSGNDNDCVDGASELLSTVSWCSQVGAEYLILVHGFDGQTGDFELDVFDDGVACDADVACLPPVNDLCEDAIPLEVPSFTIGTTHGATNDNAFPDCGTSINTPGVWYSVNGTGTTMTATTCTDYFDYDTKISVFCGSCEEPTCVAGNNNDCVDGASELLSTVSWCSQLGAEYLILVHGFNGQRGAFQLDVFDDGLPCTADVKCVPPGVVSFFSDPAEFAAALLLAGSTLTGFEDFSENTLPDSTIDPIDDPLDANTSDAESFPEGILIDNLTFQSNTGGADSSVPAPAGVEGLALATTGFQGATADMVVSNSFVHALDILSGPPAGDNHTALGMTLVTLSGGTTVRVDIYDKEENLLGSATTNVPPPADGGRFLGIILDTDLTIGRVNIWDPGNGSEGVYDVAAYVTDPCQFDLDHNGSVGAIDLIILLCTWGGCADCKDCPADFDGNCTVGSTDLILLLANWGPVPCP